jgi:predicted metalloprotease with PDZ domain
MKLSLLVTLLIGIALPSPAWAQDPVWYEVSFPNAAHHEAEIVVTFPDLEEGTLELRMSRSSPGRYALHEFGKNVYDVRVVDGMGSSLPVRRPDPYLWVVDHPAGDVRVSYTLFADLGDGTYSGIDRSMAHLNMPATLMWARGLEDQPVRVDFRPPDGSGWQVATQLVPTGQPYTYTASDLQYLMDSPTHLGRMDVREWKVGPRNEYTVRLAVHHEGTSSEVDDFEEDVRRIVDVTGDIWGEFPRFDFGTYTFISAYLPWAGGDGMEHRNSTSLTSTGGLDRNVLDLAGTVAHEFFHAWNVERLRPASLEPFDFERANLSGELWFAEGFTSYYTTLILRRAGLIDDDGFASRIGNDVSLVSNGPGRRFRSPVEMSMHAPFVDRAVSVDPNNHGNTFVSYYTWGSVVAMGLDLELRHRFGGAGLSLDAFMRAAWERFGRDETPYAVDDLEGVLADLTGDSDFASLFFDLYIRGRQLPDFERLLPEAGMALRPRDPEAAWAGPLQFRAGTDGAVLDSYTLIGTPLYDAGLDRGDRITSLAGTSVTAESGLEGILQGLEPGDEVEIEFWSRGDDYNATLVLDADPAVEVVTFEALDRDITPEIAAFRSAWLDGR